jgi:hypothetical protein
MRVLFCSNVEHLIISATLLFFVCSATATKIPLQASESQRILEGQQDTPNCQRAVSRLSKLSSHILSDKTQCSALASRFHDSVFIGQSGTWAFWDAKQAEVVPACRVEPSSADDISSILGTLVQNECHFAVKSGGHERTAGASNAAGGVTIDLARLNSIQIAEDRQSITLGAGLLWGDIYQGLEAEKLMILGGRIADVGIGGLLLGGNMLRCHTTCGMYANVEQEEFRFSLIDAGWPVTRSFHTS